MNKKFRQFKWFAATLMLVAAMVMPSVAWADGSITPSKPKTGDGSAASPYQIGTAAELYWFAGLVNGDTNVCNFNADTNPEGTQQNKAACAVLTANIVVNSGLVDCNTMLGSLEYDTSGNVTNGSNFVAWTPIGFNYQNYIGTFDGKGYTVSGLYFNDTSKEKVGLFGRVDSGGKISNVGVLDSYFEFKMQGGGICGLNYGEINNCTNGGTVIGNSTGSGAGGVCGMNYGTVKDCKNTGSVSGTVTCIGGVCGAFYSGSIENCLNEGTVSGTGDTSNSSYGGVCGRAFGGVIKLSSNTASVSGLNVVGGVCGSNQGATLEDCYNTGAVIGTALSSFGGVCGSNSTGSIKNCYNTGAVSGNNKVGGVCGDNSSIITNCYYISGTATGGINGADVEGSAEVKTQKQFGSGEVCYLLNGSRSEGTEENPLAWYQNISPSSRDLYPVLTGTGTNTVYQVKILCGGTDDVGKAYSNTNKDITVEHILIGPAVFNSGKKIYSKICQREGCGKTLYYADAAGTIKATPNAEETAFAVASYTLADPTPYDNQAVFTATNFTYTRTFSNTNWTTWYVPFELTLTPEICSKFAFSRINNVHQYDTDNDGNAGKTVVESFRQTAGVTLKANYPYLVKPVSESDLNMVLNLTNVQPALAEAKSIDCQSVDYKYVFTGTYDEMGESGATLYDPYTLYSDGTWQHYRSLDPMRHYLTIESRNATTSAAAFMRSILLSVVGDEDVTGIVKIYDEERRAKETYDLGGRRIPAGSQRNGFYIENGKVIYKK